MSTLQMAVMALCAVNILQFVINQAVRRRLERLEKRLYPTAEEAVEHRRQVANMEFAAAPLSPDLRAKLDRLGQLTHE